MVARQRRLRVRPAMTAPCPDGQRTPQRLYRAPCPGCGAPVEFRSAQSTHAVCSFCRSTVVRDGDTLARMGKMAELFDDHSPLQLLAGGRWQGKAFTLVGRLQYRGASGTWTEWNALFDDGSSGRAGRGQRRLRVLAAGGHAAASCRRPTQFRVGADHGDRRQDLSASPSNEQVALISAQGELPKLPPLGQPFAMVELRSPDGEVLGIDYGARAAGAGARPLGGAGRAAALRPARRQRARKTRRASSPARNCGAPVEVAAGRPARASPAAPATA